MLKSVNISTSSLCGANCIFCPTDRGNAISKKLMSFDLFKKIIDEVSSDAFKCRHQVETMVLGENGDAFLNKNIIEMLRYIKTKLPHIKVILCSNFQNFKEEDIETVVKENLVSIIRTNIDGSNPENYFYAKRLKLEDTDRKIKRFVEKRKEFSSNISLSISVLTLNKYVTSIKNNFGFYPSKMNDREILDKKDDFEEIKQKYTKILDNKTDRIFRIYGTFGWAERNRFKPGEVDYDKYACPNLMRIRNEAFIAPDGTWYACCFDSANQLKIGNLNESSLDEIYNSEKRKNLIKNLENRDFKKNGGPCLTVNCCQVLSEKKFISEIYRLMFKNKLITKLLYFRYNMDKLKLMNISRKLKIYILLFAVTIVTAGGSIVYLSDVAQNSDTLAARQYPAPNINNSHETGVMAVNLVDHHIFSLSEIAPFEPDVFRTPGHPVFLAIFYSIFRSFYPVLAIQILCLFLTTILIFKMALKLMPEKWAFAVSVLYLFLPSTMLSASYLGNENLFVFIFAIALYVFFFSEIKNLYFKWALTGFLLALTAYVRPVSQYILLFFIPAYFIFFIKGREISRKHILAAVLLILVFMGTLAPWCLRNKNLTGVFTFNSTSSFVLFRQNAAQFYQTLSGLGPGDSRVALEKMAGIPAGPVPIDLKYEKVMKKVALEVILSHPLRYTFFHLSGFVSFFTGSGAQLYWRFIKDTQSNFNPPNEPSLLQALNPFSWPTVVTVFKNHGWTLLECAFWGVIALLVFLGVWRSKNVRLSRMFLAIILYFAFVTGPMSYARYRVPVEPLLLIGAFSSAYFWWSRYKEKQ
jgi:radical SAM protein with 4Fe4S-binding SPASM domain